MSELINPEWIKDRQDRRNLLRAKIRDMLRYGWGSTYAMLASFREREVFWKRLARDPELRRAVEHDDAVKRERGYGITSSGYIVGSAGDYI